MCPRTDRDGLKKVGWLPLVQWSLEEFKKAFPPKSLDLIKLVQMCGTWGDPAMNKELLEICKYIIDTSEMPRIQINTNGSLRDTEWWANLGDACQERLTVIFGVDGKDQEQHEKYRAFTDHSKVLENMKALSGTKAEVRSQTIIFKHNQDDLEEIKKRCFDYGSTKHDFVWTDRYDSGDQFEYKGPEGEVRYLEKATIDPKLIFEEDEKKAAPVEKSRKEEKTESSSSEEEQPPRISCQWMNKQMIVINPDGQVLPCCYFSNSHHRGNQFFHDHPVIQNYNGQAKEHNIFHNTLENIINDSSWFNDVLINSWNGDNPVSQCIDVCSVGGKRFKQEKRVSQKGSSLAIVN